MDNGLEYMSWLALIVRLVVCVALSVGVVWLIMWTGRAFRRLEEGIERNRHGHVLRMWYVEGENGMPLTCQVSSREIAEQEAVKYGGKVRCKVYEVEL